MAAAASATELPPPIAEPHVSARNLNPRLTPGYFYVIPQLNGPTAYHAEQNPTGAINLGL